MSLMFIMRGIPSSGKTTTALKLWNTLGNAVLCSADHYFGGTPEEYKANFHWNKLAAAHAACMANAEGAIRQGSHVIVDNCNVKHEHYKPYLSLAERSSYTPIIVESAWSEWRDRIKPAILAYQERGTGPMNKLDEEARLVAEECANRNAYTHGCPAHTILKMMREWET